MDQPGPGRPDKYLRPLFAPLLLIAALRIVITAGQPILAIGGADHDDGHFLHGAIALLRDHWLGEYNFLTLAKGPGYAMFLAANYHLGLPLLVTEALFYLGGCAAFVTALRRFGFNRALLIVLFAVLAFCPGAYEAQTYRVLREGVYPAITLWTVAAAIGLAGSAQVPGAARFVWSLLLGVSLTALVLTREEGIWLLGTVAMLIVTAVWRAYRAEGAPLFRIAAAVALAAIPVAMMLGGTALVRQANKHVYGVAVVTEMTSEPFERGIGALMRVEHPHWRRYVPVPRDVREAIYQQSPAFATLRPYLEDSPNWIEASCSNLPDTCDDIAGGWFLWAVRDSARRAGYYSSAPTAEAYYTQLALEVDAACAEGRLTCGPPHHSLIPPLRAEHFEALPAAILHAIRVVGDYDAHHGANFRSLPSLGDSAQYPLIQALTHNVLSPTEAVTFVVSSWAHAPGGPLMIRAVQRGEEIEAEIDPHQPSDDVARALADPTADHTRFSATIVGGEGVALEFLRDGVVVGRIHLHRDERSEVEKVDPSFQSPPPTFIVRAGAPGVSVFDRGGLESNEARMQAVKGELQMSLARVYGLLQPWLLGAGFMAYCWIALGLLRLRVPVVFWVATALLGAVVARILLISLADVTSMPSIGPKHFGPIYPLALGFCFVSLGTIAGSLWPRLHSAFNRKPMVESQ
jgi:hypothetical protein